MENIINGKTYIGKQKTDSSEKDYYYGGGKYIRRAVKKYGRSNFKKYILESFYSNEEVCFYEKLYIKFYRQGGKAEYNISAGGDGNTRTHLLEETKKKISEGMKVFMKGKPFFKNKTNEEISDICSKIWLGKHHTESSKLKNRENHLGTKNGMYNKNHSDEAKKKMSEKKILYWKNRRK